MVRTELGMVRSSSADVPTRPVRMAQRQGVSERRADGTVLLRTAIAPLEVNETWNDRLAHWASTFPNRPFLTQATEWGHRRTLTFGQTMVTSSRVAAALLSRGLNDQRPIAIIGENSIEVAQVTLGAMLAGIPASPISPSYALKATDFAKLRDTIAALGPGMVFVQDGARYGPAVRAAVDTEVPILSAHGVVEGRETELLTDFMDPNANYAANSIGTNVTADTIAKILFTSGSSGTPKPVILPHRMLADNRAQLTQVYAFLRDEPPQMVDWLPWHHTFGGNNNFGFALWCGGTLHIDDGKPNPAGIGKTVELLKRYPPNIYFNSPSGFEALLPHLREDAALRRSFFSRLKLIQYGGAMLPEHIWEALDDIAVAETGTRILIVSGLGSTECGPTPVQSSWEQHRKPEAGLPVPGVIAKLVPAGDTYELRLKGDCVTPGYWRRPDLTAQAFDEEGFFLLGDAVKPIDPDDFGRGLLFDGRISDNFKLATGTWVPVVVLRQRLIAGLAPLLTDAVITGHDRNEVGAIGFPDMTAARLLTGLGEAATTGEILASRALRAWISERLKPMAAEAGGSSQRIARLILSEDPPSLDNGELTDKGTASARAVLQRRRDLVAALHATVPTAEIVVA